MDSQVCWRNQSRTSTNSSEQKKIQSAKSRCASPHRLYRTERSGAHGTCAEKSSDWFLNVDCRISTNCSVRFTLQLVYPHAHGILVSSRLERGLCIVLWMISYCLWYTIVLAFVCNMVGHQACPWQSSLVVKLPTLLSSMASMTSMCSHKYFVTGYHIRHMSVFVRISCQNFVVFFFCEPFDVERSRDVWDGCFAKGIKYA